MGHLRSYARPLTLAFTAAVVLIATLSLTPTAQAVNSDWTHEIVSGISDNIAEGDLTHDGERLGLVYKQATSGTIGFSIRSSAGTWAQKTADITAGGLYSTTAAVCKLAFVTGTTWLISCTSTTHSVVWKSTDDGSTWSITFDNNASAGAGTFQVFAISGNTVGLVYGKNTASSSNGISFRRSADAGGTWGSEILISDNKANPAQTGTSIILPSGFNAVDVQVSGGYVYVVIAENGNLRAYAAVAAVSDIVANSLFWSDPYTNSCSAGAVYADSGTVSAPIAGPGGAGSYAGIGLVVGTAQNLATLMLFGTGGGHAVEATTDFTPCDSPTQTVQDGSTCTDGSTFYGANNRIAMAENSAEVKILAERCAAGANANKFLIWLKTGTGSWSVSYSESGQQPTEMAADMTASKAFVVYASSATGRAELLWSSTPTAAAAVPNNTFSVTNLVGFDVDPTGGTVIARYDGGQTVGVFSGQSLGTAVQTVDTDCNRDSGVTAFTLDVAYVTCTSSGNANFLRIRTNELDHITTVPGGQCDSSHPIHSGEDDYSLNADPEAFVNEARTFQLLSVDFTQAQASSSSGIAGTGVDAIPYCRLQAAFGASFETGKVGVLTADAARCISDDCRVNMDASRRIASAWSQYDPAGAPISHVCAVIPITIPGQTSQAAVMAADDSGTTKVYMWNRDTYTPGISLAESAAGIFTQGRGIGCGKGDRALVLTATKLAAFNVTSQTQAWAPKTLPSVPPQRGVAMSYDGKWGAFVNGTTVQLVNMTSGATPSCGAIPLRAGTFKELRLTEKAQNLYEATSTGGERWDITACTTGTSQGEGGFDDGCGPTAPTQCPGTGGSGGSSSTTSLTGALGTDTIFGGLVNGFAIGLFGGSVSAGKLLVSVIFILGFAGIGYDTLERAPKVGAMLGAVLGLVIALAIGLFPVWPIVVAVVLALAYVWYRTRG